MRAFTHLSCYRRRERQGTLARVDAALRAAGIHPVEMVEVAALAALKRMAAAGVAAVPCIAVEREAAAGCLRALELDARGNPLGHKDKPSASGVALIREVISG
jgi:DNA-binding transcriptional LysR family regulator